MTAAAASSTIEHTVLPDGRQLFVAGKGAEMICKNGQPDVMTTKFSKMNVDNISGRICATIQAQRS